MKLSKFVLVLGTFIMTALFFSACSKTNEPTVSKTSTVLLKADSRTLLSDSILVLGGDLALSAFDVNLAKIQIQENSGVDVEQEGENNDGDTNDAGSETEMPDIILDGPFNLNIAGGSVELGSFAVYPGTFNKVDLFFMVSSEQPYNGNSIVMNGDFTNQAGTTTPVILNSKFDKSFETLLADNGITVTENTTVPVTIIFDFDKIFTNLDFSSATVTNGTILIDDSHNTQLLTTFENNLNNSVELEHEG